MAAASLVPSAIVMDLEWGVQIFYFVFISIVGLRYLVGVMREIYFFS